jgi:hypothetical protein
MEDSKESSGGKMNMSQLQAVNRIKYALPTNLNVVERRQNKVNFSDQNQYTSAGGSEVVIRLQASTDYVYGKNSYLVMNVDADITAPVGSSGTAIGFQKNTALSLFDRVLFEDRSGAELERNDNLNAYAAQVCPLHWSKEYVKTGVANAGQFDSADNVYTVVSGISVPSNNAYLKNGAEADYNINNNGGSPLTVVIPLRWILGVFNNETLIPSMLLSGALIRLRLASPTRALRQLATPAGGAITAVNYRISNPRVVCDSLSLSPVVQKNLMEQSQAGGGLDYTYETVYYQSANPGTNRNFNLQVNKAVSRCQKLYWSARNDIGDAVAVDNLGTAECKISQLDYRLGDMFFPQRVIDVSNPASKNGAELYENTLQSIHRMKTNVDPPSIDKFQYLKSGNDSADNNGHNTHCQSFEMSSALEYSGLAINNSRTLEARINFEDNTNRIIDAWICYLKLAKCNQLRAIIKE